MTSLVFEEGPKAPQPAISRKQLLPHIVDGMAMARPQAVYAEYPTNPDSYSDGFSKLTYGAFANVINGLAWSLEDQLGPGNNFETLVYFGPNDFRQNALVLAACKAGYKVGVHYIQKVISSDLYHSSSYVHLGILWPGTRICSKR